MCSREFYPDLVKMIIMMYQETPADSLMILTTNVFRCPQVFHFFIKYVKHSEQVSNFQ